MSTEKKYKDTYDKLKNPLTKEEIEEGNNLIVKFLGYIYEYDGTEDYSDIGGCYTSIKYYSKIQLEFKYVHENEVGEGCLNKDYSQYIITRTGIGWNFDADHIPESLMYNKDWNWLMPVAKIILEEKQDLCNDEFWNRDYVWYSMAWCNIDIVFKSIVRYIKEVNKKQ